MHKIGICVPYRNREKHLNRFIPHISKILKDNGLDYEVFICNQVDEKPFNKGKLLNIAFLMGVKNGCDYFAFNDIDTLPIKGNDDYSYPDMHPIHLSSEIDEYDDSIPYSENFGGCVLFTKDQFKEINGFSNDYWGWGYEDDDMYWRCKEKGYLKLNTSSYDLGVQNIANFNGVESSIITKSSDSISGVGNESYTVSLLIKSRCLHMMEPYIYGDSNSVYKSSTILSRGGFDLIVYSNSQVVNHFNWNEDNSQIEAWANIKHDRWVDLTLTYDRKKSLLGIYCNGLKINSVNISEKPRQYYNTPLVFGDCDTPYWNKTSHNNFRGDVAEVCIWNRCLNEDEIKSIYTGEKYYINNNGLKLHYDFNEIENGYVIDKSGFGNHGKLNNVHINKHNIGKIILSEEPFRRNNKYFTLPHDKQGVVDGSFIQKENSLKNARQFLEKIIDEKKLFCESGLNDVKYDLVNYKKIEESCFMYDVML